MKHKSILFLLISILFCNLVFAQDGEPHTNAERMPQFPGGEAEMTKYIGSKLRYPIDAQKAGVEGKITIRFVVNNNGEITDATVIKKPAKNKDEKGENIQHQNLKKLMEDEAIRIINAMPNWTAGVHEGKAVSVYFTLPIMFRLKDEKNNLSKHIYISIRVSTNEYTLTPFQF